MTNPFNTTDGIIVIVMLIVTVTMYIISLREPYVKCPKRMHKLDRRHKWQWKRTMSTTNVVKRCKDCNEIY